VTGAPAHRPRFDRSFERLYRRHVGEVYRFALAVLANPADAEDVTQTTFLNAYRAYQGGQRPERPRNWLIVIAQNVCRQRFRQAARRPGEVAFEDDAAEALEDEAPQLEDVRVALSQLAHNQRAALVMREVGGYSYNEIAEALGLSLSAVETLVFRARRALREQLESTLTCSEAERAISRQLDRRLSRVEKGALRAHLRACPECSTLARRMRAQRSALRAFTLVPLPSSLGGLFGGASTVGTGAVAAGAGLTIKAAAFGAAALLVAGGSYEAVRHTARHREAHPQARAVASVQHPSAAVSTSAPSPAVMRSEALALVAPVRAMHAVLAHASHRAAHPGKTPESQTHPSSTTADVAALSGNPPLRGNGRSAAERKSSKARAVATHRKPSPASTKTHTRKVHSVTHAHQPASHLLGAPASTAEKSKKNPSKEKANTAGVSAPPTAQPASQQSQDGVATVAGDCRSASAKAQSHGCAVETSVTPPGSAGDQNGASGASRSQGGTRAVGKPAH
jgi:RNA polymerase sigma factor (sigma-70 family)